MPTEPSNFDFLKQEWRFLYEDARAAERNVNTQPRGACFYARFTLEKAVHWLYDNDSYLRRPYEDTLGALIHEKTFKENLRPGLFPKVRIVLINGNNAVHDEAPISSGDALHTVKELFHFLFWLSRSYSHDAKHHPKVVFNAALIPRPEKEAADLSAGQVRALQKKLDERDALLAGREAELQQSKEEIAVLQKEIQALKAQNEAVPDDHDYTEAETREYYIDLLLKEAGWPLDKEEDREYEVTGMPTASGKGFVDYVRWGDDGLPLAVVEAKRTKKDPRIGQRQAELYADCLEAPFGQRPLIFYTNGYEIWLWDDLRYPPRQVSGFYKKDELEHLIQQRSERKPLGTTRINEEITGRYYQTAAIRSVCETFEKKSRRRALLVMATGTGKTRTAIAIVDLMMRAGWVKRVLVLADRNALVRQAANAFKEHLPTVTPVDLTKDKENISSRLILSTYPTMMNSIDAKREGERRFSPGHFDLIIIDEAHRSVYKKYGAIFDYFDALLLGLTATPRDEVDRNTYRLFGLEQGVPTYYYELDEAVADDFLAPPQAHSVPLKFQREGITYSELSEEEKEEYELTFFDEETGEIPEKIDSAALNLWLFNANTVDQVLKHLMENGIKVEGGDRLGKTIIFARNHKHAVFIQERFDENYPHLAGKFARVIDSHDPYADNLLDAFSGKTRDPVIAISVDMLDTGIDIHEIVNLVFFKLVRSKTKFHQMLGRGTRLCPDLFGPGEDKACFYVFDFCENFEFFEHRPEGVKSSPPEPMGSRIFKLRLALATRLADADAPEEHQALRAEVLDTLHHQVRHMNPDNFIVRPKRFMVEIYSDRTQWEHLTPDDRREIETHLAGLPTEFASDDEFARRFDLMMLNLQLALLDGSNALPSLRDKVREVAFQLEGKASIPMVTHQLDLIEELQTDAYWNGVTVPMLEGVRKRLRLLVKFIDRSEQKIVYTDFRDEIGVVSEVTMPEFASAESRRQYRRRVEQYIRTHQNHIAIHKLKHNRPLTPADLDELGRMLYESEAIESREKFEQSFKDQMPLGVFIRRLVGLDQQAAKRAFGKYLEDSTLGANQIHFINQIINYLTQNGVMDPGLLYESPFTDIHSEGLDGVFDDTNAKRIVGIIRSINENAA